MKIINVVCAVIVKDDKVLACKRGPGRALAGFFEFPGGKVKENESQEDALKREIKEELGADIKLDVYQKNRTYEHVYEKEELTVYMKAFYCELLSDFQLTEHTEYKWLGEDELDTVNWAEIDKEVVNNIRTDLVKERYIISLEKPEWRHKIYSEYLDDIKDKVEVVWSRDSSFVTAYREFDQQIRNQLIKKDESHGNYKFRSVSLYDKHGKTIVHES